jgi:large subunit ribosomal protein L9
VSQVKLILVESVHRLGEVGDLVSVKPGFARNYLLPQGKAILATESRVAELEHHKRIVADKVAREMKDLQAVKKKIEGLKIEIGARAGEEGKLFGSVTAAQIAEQLALQGLTVDRRRIESDPIKTVGEHDVPIKLHRDVVATLSLHVAAEGGEPAPPTEEEETPDEEEAAD